MMEPNTYCMILTTCPNQDEAYKIASLLINQHLAACVQASVITSFYEWKGKVNADSEQLLFIKALSSNYEKIEASILANHSYEVPEIIMIPVVRGSEQYLKWIDEVSG